MDSEILVSLGLPFSTSVFVIFDIQCNQIKIIKVVNSWNRVFIVFTNRGVEFPRLDVKEVGFPFSSVIHALMHLV